MSKRSLWLLAGLVLVASLIVGPGATASPAKTNAGTIVFIHDQEPPNLQGPWVGNNLYATSLVLNNIWYGCQIRNSAAAFVPRLCAAKPTVTKRSPLTVRFTYKKEAVWSDGKPVVAEDFWATWQVFVNAKHNPISRTGWEDIRSVTRGNAKTVTVVFKKVYADWESLVSSGPYPAHIVKGKDMNEMFLNNLPVSSGPWRFASWQKGVQITVTKNARFKAGPAMKLDRLVFRYILDTNSRFQALKAGEGQVMEPQPQLQIADFMKDSKFKVDTKVGYTYEHIDFQFGKDGHPALKQPYVRQALIQGMNRPQVAGALYGEISKGLPALQSLIYKPFETPYKKNFDQWKFNQTKVISLLKGKGCTGGPDRPSSGNDKIFSCPNVGKLSFRFYTTTGNQLRALTFEIIQRQLKSVGIELLPRFETAGVMFGTTLPSRNWDLMLFAWVGSPASSITVKDILGCGGDQNDGAYCNQALSKVLTKVSTTLDAGERARLLNDAELKYVAKDIPSIPMFARPLYTINAAKVKGVGVNPTQEGSPWNISSWAA
ncbi:MAG TPA: peptide ABC transporter substrate-binding protein [Gaiellaceae bacterium]|nr:peptide ABC transporter substrate-binding protein [Gaiellaceae bacterium]